MIGFKMQYRNRRAGERNVERGMGFGNKKAHSDGDAK